MIFLGVGEEGLVDDVEVGNVALRLREGDLLFDISLVVHDVDLAGELGDDHRVGDEGFSCVAHDGLENRAGDVVSFNHDFINFDALSCTNEKFLVVNIKEFNLKSSLEIIGYLFFVVLG